MKNLRKIATSLVLGVALVSSLQGAADASLWSNKRGCSVYGHVGKWQAWYTDNGSLEGIGPKRFFYNTAVKDCNAWVAGG